MIGRGAYGKVYKSYDTNNSKVIDFVFYIIVRCDQGCYT